MKRFIVALAVGALLVAVTPARAVVAVAIPSAELLESFVPPVAATAKGGPFFLLNTDLGIEHSIVSVAKRPENKPWCDQFDVGQCPLFYAEAVVQGQSEVLGLENTASGRTYNYYCGVHQRMTGALHIL
ncbi:MAG TPA: hypothetical protein VM600_10140 [Actinomycetota bacterium]|nr:hypothetical protein [Actinomycetota bacterium]